MVDVFKTNSKEVGIYVDENYQSTEYVQELIKLLPDTTLITFPFITDEDIKTRNEVLLKTNNPVQYWRMSEYETERMSRDKQELLADHMFVSYLRFFEKSRLYIFPHMFGEKDSVSYSARAQALIIKAHLVGVKYNVIKEGSLDDFYRS